MRRQFKRRPVSKKRVQNQLTKKRLSAPQRDLFDHRIADAATTRTKRSIEDGGPERRITAFVAMPFAKEYQSLYNVIRESASAAGVIPLRADEVLAPGPIVNQIFDALGAADCVVAEVSSRNPNVYYELALAHCVQKPSILLARRDRLDDLPFDVRHNRVIPYDSGSLDDLIPGLTKALEFVKTTLVLGRSDASFEEQLQGLSPNRNSAMVLDNVIQELAQEFHLVNPRLQEQSRLQDTSYSVTIVDDFGERVVFVMDINGIIRRKKRLS